MAEFYELISLAAPSDAELYSELVEAAPQVVNPEVSYTLQILADMYRKALDIGGGFNVLYRTIEGIIQDLDPEEEESDQVENLLNKIGASVRVRARQPDSPQAMRELQNAASEAKRRMAEQAPEVPDEPQEDEGSIYEQALLGDYETPEKMFEEEGGVAKFDPTGGVKPEEAAQGKGRGYSVGKAYSFKDWAAVYANEQQRYVKDLTDPDSMVTKAVRTARQNNDVKNDLTALVKVLGQLSEKTRQAMAIEYTISVETEVPHPKEEAELEKIRAELRRLEGERVNLKRRLNVYYKKAELENLRKQETATTDMRQKRILQQKVALQELRLSGKKGYGKESKERQKLIDSLTADPNLSEVEVKKQEDNIQQASAFTNRVSKAMYDRAKTLEKAKLKGVKTDVKTREEMQEKGVRAPKHLGMGVIHDYKLNEIALEGLIVHLTQRLATERVVVKQKITDKMKKAKLDPNLLKPYLDNVAKAASKKNRDAFLAASAELRKKMVEFKNFQPEVRQFASSLKYSKFFYGFRDRVKKIGEWLGQPLDGDQLAFISATVRDGKKLIEYPWKDLPALGGGRGERSTYYGPPLEIIENIVRNLEGLKHE